MVIDTLVIGAGWAGLTAARALVKAGRDVVVLEKSRGPGGRSATRRGDGARFDHGAQYFTAHGAAFGRHLQQWRDAGLVQPWRPRLAVIGERSAHYHEHHRAGNDGDDNPEDTRRFVAVPGMNGVCRHLADDLDCRFGQRVTALQFDGQWQLQLDTGLDSGGKSGLNSDKSLQARRLLISLPPAQAAELLGDDDPLHDQLAAIGFRSCIAGMLSFKKPFDPGFDAAFVNQPGPLSWVACNSSKPERTGNNWVLHASARWSQARLDQPSEQSAGQLAEAFAELVGAPLPRISVQLAHRWRYAQAEDPLDKGLIADEQRCLAIAGDWLSGSRIEGAWTSGRKAGEWLGNL